MSYIRVRLIQSGDVLRPQQTLPLRDACSLYEKFHRFAPDLVARSSCRRTIPEVLVKIGKLRGLIYSSDKGDRGCPKSYIHFMEQEPLLACDAKGTQLYILGGNYRVTRRGIEG